MDKYKNFTYKTGSFLVGSSINLDLIMCKDKVGITLISPNLCIELVS